MKLVVDSSVIVSAIKPAEKFHTESIKFFGSVGSRRDEVWTPMTLLWEMGAALDHPGKTPPGTTFHRLFNIGLSFVPVDEGLFQRTWKPDLRIPVKGVDRVFLSCALEKPAVLVSWDENLVRNTASVGVKPQTPPDYVRSR